MDTFLLAAVVAAFAWALRVRSQRQRIALLGSFLAPYQVEKHMETLSQGYLRALGEADSQRREQIWYLLRSTEQELSSQVARLASDFARVDPLQARVSKLPSWVPLAHRWPVASFDMREALALHARGIRRAVEGQEGATAPDRAFAISAELFLLQHTCHWFCKSRFVASARLLARHKTSYEQVLAAVLPQTRSDYATLVG
jgi:hypothetical protein